MQIDAALDAITGNSTIFASKQLARLDLTKTKALKLPAKLAYFHGGSTYHRVAVVCPLQKTVGHDQLLLAGLMWANKVSNGQKTVLYLVGKGFDSRFGHLVQMFGPQIEIRLVYFTPKLETPLVVAARETKLSAPRYTVPLPREQSFWERKLNPVEKGWFLSALNYFRTFRDREITVCILENWVSIKFRGQEIVRISKKESRLRIALITRYPREIPGCVGVREEREGWFNAQGELNAEFVRACEHRLEQLRTDHDLFARVCPEKQRLENVIRKNLPGFSLEERAYFQLDVGCKGETSLCVDLAGRTSDGTLVVGSIHPQRDLLGLVHCLEQLTWARTQFSEIRQAYFGGEFLAEAQAWLICPQNRMHPEVEVLRSLIEPQHRVKALALKDGWQENGACAFKFLE